MGAETAPAARLPSSALAGSWAAMSASGAALQPRRPAWPSPPPARTASRTRPGPPPPGPPLWLANDRRGEAGGVELGPVLLEVALQVGLAGADPGQVLLQRAGRGDELHLLVDERGRHRAQHLGPGQRLAGDGCSCSGGSGPAAVWRIWDITAVICPVEVGAGVGQLGRGHADVVVGRQLQHELVADLGVEVGGHEGAVSPWGWPRVWPGCRHRRPAAAAGRRSTRGRPGS